MNAGKLVVGALAAVLLAGCATYSEMQQKPPLIIEHTDKSTQAFVDCALPRVVDVQADTHAMRDGNATVIVIPIGNRGGDLAGTITATPAPTGSTVDIRAISGRSATRIRETVKPCL